MNIRFVLLSSSWFLSFMIYSLSSRSQDLIDSIRRKDLVGLWQFDSPVVGNGLRQHYEFHEDGSYILFTNSWAATSPTVGFKGQYKIKRGTQLLTITIDSTMQGENCHYEFDDDPGIFADWIMVCEKYTTLPY